MIFLGTSHNSADACEFSHFVRSLIGWQKNETEVNSVSFFAKVYWGRGP